MMPEDHTLVLKPEIDHRPAAPAATVVSNWRQPAFGQRLKQMRTQRGLRQSALTGDGMSAGYLSRLEHGERPPTARAVAYLAERLGVSLDAFNEEAPDHAEERALSRLLASAAVVSRPVGLAELKQPLAEALGRVRERVPELRWQALWLLAEHAAVHGEHAEELEWLQRLSVISDELDIPELQVRARTEVARSHRELGSLDQTLKYAWEALAIAREQNFGARDVVPVLLVLVSAEAEAGRLPEAVAHVGELLPLAADVSDVAAAKALWTAATVRSWQGDGAGARQLMEEALLRLDSHDDLTLWMRLRLAAAALYLRMQTPLHDAAATCLDQAAATVALIGTELHRQELLSLQAHLAFVTGDVDTARELVRQLDGMELRLAFYDRSRLEMLRCRLLILDGRVADGVKALKQLAGEAHEALNTDLALDIWRLIAETLEPDDAEQVSAPGSALG